jgi:very-short-patch-repair endonuclease
MAATMRNNPTPAEQAMWEILKKEVMPKFPEHKFKQQQVVLGYILDFYCETLRFGIEVDGGVHKDSEQYDCHRDKILARNGVQVLRIRNETVINKPQRLAFKICETIKYKTMP